MLAVLTPGLGHVYSGRPARGLAVWALSVCGAVVGLAAALALPGRPQAFGIAALILAIPFLGAWDAAKTARRSNPYRLRAFNRWYVYLGIMLLSALVWQPFFLAQLEDRLGGAFRLASGAMEPTLHEGEYILSVPLRGVVSARDIVIYQTARGKIVQRVVGVPGDTISMRAGQLTVNGRIRAEPYVRRDPDDPVSPEFAWQEDYLLPSASRSSYRASLHNWGPIVVPKGDYFLMGDNRNSSLDSRYIGFVSRRAIVARPTIIYLSRDVESGTIRWRRLGRAADR